MIAAFGVVWIHTWAAFGTPKLMIGPVDFYQAIAILGNGVDFFFVISGFCMYLMTANKKYSLSSYWQFLKKRFIRIAPAFYVAVLVYGVLKYCGDTSFPIWREMGLHFLFLNNFTGSSISSPFWSIATEWNFYILLPLLVILNTRYDLGRSLLLISLASVLFFCIVNFGLVNADFWQWQIFVKFPEFAVGIFAAHLFKKGKNLPLIFSGWKGLFLAFTVMYVGRFLKFTSFVEWAGSFGFILKSIADTVMVIGFAIVLLHVITQPSMLSQFLSGKFVTWLGRISYSVYLWHSLVILLTGQYLINLPFPNFNVLFGFFSVCMITILISAVSYQLLESFYFRRRTQAEVTELQEQELAVKKGGV